MESTAAVPSSSSHRVLVIGGGAAGMVAAWRAASLGSSVILLEKNSRLGIKILVSGGGKCNVTHAGGMEEMRLHFQMHEARFLRHAFHSFSNADIRALLQVKGVATYERPNGKVFPVDEKAGDIVHAFRRMMEEAGVDIRCSSPVTALRRDADGIIGVELGDGTSIGSRHIILATGGVSYRKTGTTGDGYRWAEAMGHSIVRLRPALAPIVTDPVPPREWQGIAVRDAALLACADGKIIARYSADVLFTHFGVSGPAVLELSNDIVRLGEHHADVSLAVDFLPSQSAEEIDQSLRDDIIDNGAQEIKTWLERRIPQRLVPYFCQSCSVNGATKSRQLKKDDRRAIIRGLKQWTFGSVKEIDLDRGEVTSGGVTLQEVDPKSMRSRVAPGLYCCGEILDIAGPVGGYNLQAAFSTGFVAGSSAAHDAAIVKNSP